MTATAKPNSISCACHSSGATLKSSEMCPRNKTSQSGTANAPNTAAAR